MKLKAKYIDMDTGEITALLHVNDCQEMGVREQDRIKLKHENETVTAIVHTTERYLKPGEIGLLGKAFKFIGPEVGEILEVMPTGKPESVEFIRKKMDGLELTTEEISTLVNDISLQEPVPGRALGVRHRAAHQRDEHPRDRGPDPGHGGDRRDHRVRPRPGLRLPLRGRGALGTRSPCSWSRSWPPLACSSPRPRRGPSARPRAPRTSWRCSPTSTSTPRS